MKHKLILFAKVKLSNKTNGCVVGNVAYNEETGDVIGCETKIVDENALAIIINKGAEVDNIVVQRSNKGEYYIRAFEGHTPLLNDLVLDRHITACMLHYMFSRNKNTFNMISCILRVATKCKKIDIIEVNCNRIVENEAQTIDKRLKNRLDEWSIIAWSGVVSGDGYCFEPNKLDKVPVIAETNNNQITDYTLFTNKIRRMIELGKHSGMDNFGREVRKSACIDMRNGRTMNISSTERELLNSIKGNEVDASYLYRLKIWGILEKIEDECLIAMMLGAAAVEIKKGRDAINIDFIKVLVELIRKDSSKIRFKCIKGFGKIAIIDDEGLQEYGKKSYRVMTIIDESTYKFIWCNSGLTLGLADLSNTAICRGESNISINVANSMVMRAASITITGIKEGDTLVTISEQSKNGKTTWMTVTLNEATIDELVSIPFLESENNSIVQTIQGGLSIIGVRVKNKENSNEITYGYNAYNNIRDTYISHLANLSYSELASIINKSNKEVIFKLCPMRSHEYIEQMRNYTISLDGFFAKKTFYMSNNLIGKNAADGVNTNDVGKQIMSMKENRKLLGQAGLMDKEDSIINALEMVATTNLMSLGMLKTANKTVSLPGVAVIGDVIIQNEKTSIVVGACLVGLNAACTFAEQGKVVVSDKALYALKQLRDTVVKVDADGKVYFDYDSISVKVKSIDDIILIDSMIV